MPQRPRRRPDRNVPSDDVIDERRFRLSRLALALAAGGLVGLGSAHATVISDAANEPTNDTFPGATPGGEGDEFQGCVGNNISNSYCVYPSPVPPENDPEDFVSFGNLTSGNTYDLSLTEIPTSFGGVSLVFDLYMNGSSTSFATYTLGPPPGNDPQINLLVSGLTGLTSLTVGIQTLAHSQDSAANNIAEGYQVRLDQANGSVPEPATAVLLAAGLIGALVGGRRRRHHQGN